MGLSLSTMSLVCLLCAIYKALRTGTTTPLRSLEGLGGAFDVPKAKCPPDRGSLDCVTGSPASFSSHLTDSHSSSPSSSPASTDSIVYNSQASIPRPIPCRNYSTLSTPPLTPDNGSDYHRGNESIHEKDALDFLMTVFPHQGVSVFPHAKSVSISAPNLGSEFNGVVLDIPGSAKTLYVDGKSAESVSLRESIVALLDLADESLGCSSLIIILERSSPNLGLLLHSLMYVGGTVVTKPPYQVDPAFVLVGLEV